MLHAELLKPLFRFSSRFFVCSAFKEASLFEALSKHSFYASLVFVCDRDLSFLGF